MARLGIKRANGDIEYAELTTDKSLVGSHYLTVERYGTPYYAKLGDSVSTHLCVEGSDGQKRYVQKEVKFIWKYVVDDSHKIDGFVIPRTGKYRIQIFEEETDDTGRTHRKTSNDIYKFKKGTKPQFSVQTTIETVEGNEVTLNKHDYSGGEEEHWIYMESIEYVGD